MRSIVKESLHLNAIQAEPKNHRFKSNEMTFLAGRCLLDVVEHLRTSPHLPASFSQVTSAHGIRLVAMCLRDLGLKDLAQRVKRHVRRTYEGLLKKRQNSEPHYGDDFWDWAYIIDAFFTVRQVYPDIYDHQTVLNSEVKAFYRSVVRQLEHRQNKSSPTLSFGGKNEWFGPAVPAAVFRILMKCGEFVDDSAAVYELLGELKRLASQPIDNQGNFLDKEVTPFYHQWHYGQVLAEFGSTDDLDAARQSIQNLKSIDAISEAAHKAWALSRVIQGAVKIKNVKLVEQAIDRIYECQTLSRPLGQGLIGDTIKGSMNVLEAIWPCLSVADLIEVRAMLQALSDTQRSMNTIGVVVAIDREETQCRKAFELAGATVTPVEDYLRVDHPDYRVRIVKGKSTIDAADATRRLLEQDVKSVIMVGIAGSLGTGPLKAPDPMADKNSSPPASGKAHGVPAASAGDQVPVSASVAGPTSQDVQPKCASAEDKPQPSGPQVGDIVIAVATAPYRIRDKVRGVKIVNARVPRGGETFGILPTDPDLFILASRAAFEYMIDPKRVFEGVIVSGTGVKDHESEKQQILGEWPGAVAIEEEGYSLSLESVRKGKPHIVVRGISDMAGGDKLLSDEERDQNIAARNAAEVAVRVVKALGERWWSDDSGDATSIERHVATS